LFLSVPFQARVLPNVLSLASSLISGHDSFNDSSQGQNLEHRTLSTVYSYKLSNELPGLHNLLLADIRTFGDVAAKIAKPMSKRTNPKIKVRRPNGIAKQGFLNLAVKHPRQPVSTITIPRYNIPVLTAAKDESPILLKALTLLPWEAAKIIVMSPIRINTAEIIKIHFEILFLVEFL